MKKLLAFFASCLLLASFCLSAQASPVSLNEQRMYGIDGTVSINGSSSSARIGQWNSNEGITGFALVPGYGFDWQYNVSDASAANLDAAQLSAVKSVMAAHTYMLDNYVAGPENAWNFDTHQTKWGAVAQLLIWEIAYDGGLTDFSALLTGNFSADLASNWIWGSTQTTYEDAVNALLNLVNSSLINPDSIELTAYLTPAHNSGALSLLAYGPASPSAVPVPAAAWLLGTGLAGIVALRRRVS